MKEVRLGVIGAGGRGHISHHAHKPENGVRLVAAADVSDKPLDEFKQKFGADTFVTKDYRELLKRKDIDAVFVTSPDFMHEEQGVAALAAGKAVYCEKPLAITLKGCDRLLSTAMKHKTKLFVGHNMRYMAFVRKMKEIVDSGAIGRVTTAWCRHFINYGGDAYFKDWHSERKYATGLLLQKGAHDIDVIHWICGGYTKRVTALGALSVYDKCERRSPDEPGVKSWHDTNWPPLAQKKMSPIIDVEDQTMMLMELENGIMASYQQCHYTPEPWRNYVFIGTEGRIENFGDHGEHCVIRLWNKRGPYREKGDVEYPVSHESEGHGGADPRIVEEFVRFVRDGGRTYASAVAARYSVAAGYLATMSLRAGGKPQAVPPVKKDIVSYFDNL